MASRQNTEEAAQLKMLAEEKGASLLRLDCRLRLCPKSIICDHCGDGYLGRVLSVHSHVVRDGVLARPANRTWQRKFELGANSSQYWKRSHNRCSSICRRRNIRAISDGGYACE